MAVPVVLASDAGSQFTPILVAAAWAAFGTLNYLVWKRSKSAGHLVMTIASGWLGVDSLLQTLGVSLLGSQTGVWATALGVALLTGGFYFTVQTLVSADVARLFGRKLPLHSPTSNATAPARWPTSTPRV